MEKPTTADHIRVDSPHAEIAGNIWNFGQIDGSFTPPKTNGWRAPKWWFGKGNSLKKWQLLVSMLEFWGVPILLEQLLEGGRNWHPKKLEIKDAEPLQNFHISADWAKESFKWASASLADIPWQGVRKLDKSNKKILQKHAFVQVSGFTFSLSWWQALKETTKNVAVFHTTIASLNGVSSEAPENKCGKMMGTPVNPVTFGGSWLFFFNKCTLPETNIAPENWPPQSIGK